MYYKTKAQRQQWFNSLTPDQREEYIAKKIAEKSEQQAHRESTCPLFPAVTSENRQEWADKIQRKNPWILSDD